MMRIDKSTKGTVTIVAPKGSIDMDDCKKLRGELHGLIDTGRIAILVDFSDVDFVSSANLGILVGFAQRVDKEGGKLVLCSLNDNIQSVFDTVGFTEFFEICRDAREALTRMS